MVKVLCHRPVKVPPVEWNSNSGKRAGQHFPSLEVAIETVRATSVAHGSMRYEFVDVSYDKVLGEMKAGTFVEKPVEIERPSPGQEIETKDLIPGEIYSVESKSDPTLTNGLVRILFKSEVEKAGYHPEENEIWASSVSGVWRSSKILNFEDGKMYAWKTA